MLTIRIGSDTRRLEDADEAWITQQVNNRRREGLPVCVEVTINTGPINVRLTTPACGGGGGGGRPPRPDEATIIDLWNKRGLGTDNFSPGSVVAFLKQVSSLV